MNGTSIGAAGVRLHRQTQMLERLATRAQDDQMLAEYAGNAQSNRLAGFGLQHRHFEVVADVSGAERQPALAGAADQGPYRIPTADHLDFEGADGAIRKLLHGALGKGAAQSECERRRAGFLRSEGSCCHRLPLNPSPDLVPKQRSDAEVPRAAAILHSG
jgi:hypothetical protein